MSMNERASVTALVPALLAGREDAIAQLVDRALRPLMAIALRKGAATKEDAEEIALFAIDNTLRRLAELDLERGRGADPLFSYLATATVRGVQQRFRDAEIERAALARAANTDASAPVRHLGDGEVGEGQPVWSNAGPAAQDSAADDTRWLTQFLASLDPIDRVLAELRAYTTLTWEDIAHDLGITSDAARQRWTRIRKKAEQFKRSTEPAARGPR